MTPPRIVVVGAGPAGLRAAEVLVEAGLRPTLITEAPAPGGQIYRRPPAGFARDARQLYGFEAAKARALHAGFERLRPRLDWRPDTLVWDLRADRLHLAGPDGQSVLPHDRLILCTGATDRILPLPGWTLPGVFSLGGAQIALKAQGVAIGRRVVFLGTGPLLYLAALQYAEAGARPVAVLDTTPRATTLRHAAGLTRDPVTLAKGLYFLAALRRRGIALLDGVEPLRVEGADEVTGLGFRQGGRDRSIAVDAVALGFGLAPESQLAALADCRFEQDAASGDWLPVCDPAGRSSIPGIYLAGDGTRVGGADMAELAGARAGFAVLEDLGRTIDPVPIARLDRRLARGWRFRQALDATFPFPHALLRALPEEAVVCRCEGVTAGTLRQAAGTLPDGDLNRVKAATRLGMGRCQGRLCGRNGAEIVAAVRTGRPQALRGQPPVKPFAIRPAGAP